MAMVGDRNLRQDELVGISDEDAWRRLANEAAATPAAVSRWAPERIYYRLRQAASILDCDVDDILHAAAIGDLVLGVKPPSDTFMVRRPGNSDTASQFFADSSQLLILHPSDVALIEGYGAVSLSKFNGVARWDEGGAGNAPGKATISNARRRRGRVDIR